MFRVSNQIAIEPIEITENGRKRVIKSLYVEVSFHNAQIDSRQPTDDEIRLFMQQNPTQSKSQKE